ncbi:MAG: DUF3131 domain-containing protein [Isosphaeraceae bacterium]|nr:DUF3131 domain-containing protein [Isosphaeraceae bacterium]
MLRRSALVAVTVVLLEATAKAATVSLDSADRELLTTYARDTWRSLDALAAVGPLPADGLYRSDKGWTALGYTSPTNIAAYLWSTLAATDLGLIDREESDQRLRQMLAALGRLERAHGFFFNWYDPRTGARLQAWPDGSAVRPFLSTVDNGWLAAALIMVGNARPELRAEAEALLRPMNFGLFYDPYDPADPIAHPGLLRGGYFTDVNALAGFHYGMLNTEPRIASYIGIALGQLPREHYARMTRGTATGPDGDRIVPSWDGTMFEALMVPLFVPEADWAPASWGVNHALYVRAQIDYGLHDARLGYWGLSASCDPAGGYRAFGVAALGAGAPPLERATIITPHASFLALPFAPEEAMANLRALTRDFPVYGPYGFYDAVDITTGRVCDCILTLDQGMILAALANALGTGELQRAFSAGIIEATIRPLLAADRFEPEAGAAMALRNPKDDVLPPVSAPIAPSPAPPTAPARRRRSKRRRGAGQAK